MDPAARLHAYLSYRDASAGLRWLESVGFQVVSRQDGLDGTVQHAEVRLGEAVLMVASADAAYDVPRLIGRSSGGGLYLWLPRSSDVDAWHGRAVGAGAVEVIAPEDTEWGTRRSRVLDPEGHEWSVGTYGPGSSW
ncbi:VOC family protein [Nocardioides sp. CER19]|uniref:VOC family protein n=1 Tax=Nocardioides sp. CER19 TaxID=3038538 RepID=UPI00244867F3|nr:VOC family protein [Nocardioides sp. CER19]MDH2415939.1 VOC family protein [Nocardioides sp. CER19]